MYIYKFELVVEAYAIKKKEITSMLLMNIDFSSYSPTYCKSGHQVWNSKEIGNDNDDNDDGKAINSKCKCRQLTSLACQI